MSAVTSLWGDAQTGHAMQGASEDQINGILRSLGILNAAVPAANKDLQSTTNNANADLQSATEGATAGVNTAVTNAQTGATNAATTANAGLDPYAHAGSEATASLLSLLQNPQNFGNQEFKYDPNADPGTQFRLQQQQQAFERSAAARGGSLGGGAAKELAAFSQGQASQEYQNAFNRWDTTRGTNLKSLAVQLGGLQGLSTEGLAAAGKQGANTIDAAQYGGDRGIQGSEWTGNAGINTARYNGDRSVNTQHWVSQNDINLAQANGAGQVSIGDIQAATRLARQGIKNTTLGRIGTMADSAMSAGFGGFGGGGGWDWGAAAGGAFGIPRRGRGGNGMGDSEI